MGDRLGSWYTPLAVAIALGSWVFSGSSERFLAVLVIATPCPLLISIPVAIIGAISVGARFGIIIKDPSILEKMETCRVLIVDKTGTLTYGKPSLTSVYLHGSLGREKALQYLASVERYSKHPLAGAVLEAAKAEGVPLLDAEDVSEPPGAGLVGHVEGRLITVTGRGKLRGELAAAMPPVAPGLECVLLVDGELAGVFRFQDEPRRETKSFLKHLGTMHSIRKVILLSGDRPAEVSAFAEGMGITEFYGGKSPEEKVEVVREVTAGGAHDVPGGRNQRRSGDDDGDGGDCAGREQRHYVGGGGGGGSAIVVEERGRVDPHWAADADDCVDERCRRDGVERDWDGCGGDGMDEPDSGGGRAGGDRPAVDSQFVEDDSADRFAERFPRAGGGGESACGGWRHGPVGWSDWFASALYNPRYGNCA